MNYDMYNYSKHSVKYYLDHLTILKLKLNRLYIYVIRMREVM